MRIHFDYRSIPELGSLEPEERERVLVVSGRAFGKRRTFWVVYWLGILMTFGMPAATWLAVQGWSEWVLVPVWTVIVVALVSYTIWFQVRMHHQLPYIRECLATRAHEEEAAVQQATSESRRRFVVARGLVFGALMTALVATISELPAPWYLVLPLACIGGLMWSVVMSWVRKRLT
jgi:hypothetical protein